MKTYLYKNCTQMFIALLFIIAPKWKQSKCMSLDSRDGCLPSTIMNDKTVIHDNG